jgi:hypothetical protein
MLDEYVDFFRKAADKAWTMMMDPESHFKYTIMMAKAT